MGSSCAVAECKNHVARGQRPPGLILHFFPPKSSPVFKMWVNNCKRAEQFNRNTDVVCSDHFLLSACQRDLQNELLGLPLRRRLKKDAVPTLFPSRRRALTDSIKRDVRARLRNSLKLARNILTGKLYQLQCVIY